MHADDALQKERFREENLQAENAITENNLAEAARILVDIVQKDAENWRAYNNMGIVSWAQKSWNDAYLMFIKSVSIRPDYADALVNLFDAALKLRKITDVLPAFENACAVNPELEEIAVLRDSIREQGDAIYTSKRALSIGFYSPIIEEAKKELESGNLYKAMDMFLKANDQEGPSPEAFCGLGIISYYQKRFDDAFVLFVESLKLNPIDKDTYFNLLDAAKGCDRLKDAVHIFQTYRKELPELSVLDEDFAVYEKKD